MDRNQAEAYTTGVTDQIGGAVARGDAAAANHIVDRVAADGHPGFAQILNTALTNTSLADSDTDATGLTVVEEYAVWLAESGIDHAATDDLNEGCDPVSERGGTVSDTDWRAAMDLAHEIAEWVRTNPQLLLAAVRAGQQQS